MAVDTKHAFGRRTDGRRREIRERALLALAALILVAGTVAYFQSRGNVAPAPAPAPIHSVQKAHAPAVKPGGKLDPAARAVAVQFIRATLGRENLAQAWNLATPGLRDTVTKSQWLRGELPFPPFPVQNLATSGFRVVGSSPNQILLEVFLVPKLDSGYVPTRFELTLVRNGARAPWKMSYFSPFAPQGMYTEPK